MSWRSSDIRVDALDFWDVLVDMTHYLPEAGGWSFGLYRVLYGRGLRPEKNRRPRVDCWQAWEIVDGVDAPSNREARRSSMGHDAFLSEAGRWSRGLYRVLRPRAPTRKKSAASRRLFGSLGD